MEQQNDIEPGGNTWILSTILYMMAFMGHIYAKIMWSDFYTVTFNVLTLTSLSLAILISYPKAVKSIKDMRNKMKDKCP